MPVSRRTSEGLSDELSAAYGAAELRLLRLVASHLEAGAGAPGWAEAKLAELQVFRKRADRVMTEVTQQATGTLGEATRSAYLRGAAVGDAELVRGGVRLDSPPAQAERATEALVRAQAGQLDAMGPVVVRQTADAYRDAVVRASSGTLTGATTRVQDAQAAVDDLARQGLSGFTDASGRRWGLESYVDMATRTTTAQAAVTGHMDRLEEGGINLFLVSSSSGECDRCAPWEGKVLSRGPVDALQQNVLTGELDRVQVDGTVAEATRAGLFHPNCTHNLTGYVHGASVRDDAPHDPEEYAARQRQRAMERRTREWKRREAVALTPEAKRAARAKVRQWQAALAAHVAATGLPRKRRRENFDVTAPTSLAEVIESPALLAAAGQELLEAEVMRLMAAGDYGPRFERLSGELDRRDAVAAPTPVTLPERQVDPVVPPSLADESVAAHAALNQVLHGDDYTAPVRRPPKWSKAQRERELRAEYDTYVEMLAAMAEDVIRGGSYFSREGERLIARGESLSEWDFFTRRRSLKYASQELQEFFASAGIERLSYPEFRSALVDDEAATKANRRRRNRGYESEYG